MLASDLNFLFENSRIVKTGFFDLTVLLLNESLNCLWWEDPSDLSKKELSRLNSWLTLQKFNSLKSFFLRDHYVTILGYLMICIQFMNEIQLTKIIQFTDMIGYHSILIFFIIGLVSIPWIKSNSRIYFPIPKDIQFLDFIQFLDIIQSQDNICSFYSASV